MNEQKKTGAFKVKTSTRKNLQISSPAKNEIKPATRALLIGEKKGALTIGAAWNEGTNAQLSLRIDPQATRAFMVRELGLTLRMVDATATIRDAEELAAVIEALLEEFPAFKIEEFSFVFQKIQRGKFGTLYGRLKLPELMECCRRHEGDRAEILERAHRPDFDPYERTSQNQSKRKFLNLSESDLLTIGKIKPTKQA